MVLGVVVSGVVGSIDLVGWVGLVASVGVDLARHGSNGRAHGLRWFERGVADVRTYEAINRVYGLGGKRSQFWRTPRDWYDAYRPLWLLTHALGRLWSAPQRPSWQTKLGVDPLP